MGDADAKSGPDSIVGIGDDTDIAESELQIEVDNGIAQ